MNWVTALPLAAALISGFSITRSRWIGMLGPYGSSIAPCLLLILWFASLSLGQWTCSLQGMAWAAASPLLLIVGVAALRFKWRRPRTPSWSWIDLLILAALIALIFVYPGNDADCHYSIINTYLRGNIPPRAPDDPDAPLFYHAAFDAAAALIADAFRCGPEIALDVVSALCVAACMSCLFALSHILFERRWTRQCARLFFACGFGPIYLKLLGGLEHARGYFMLHGQTTQAFAASIHRRPMGLNWVIFLFVLAACLPRVASPSRPGIDSRRALHPAWLLPCAFLLPQVSEELTLLLTSLIVWLSISRRLSPLWGCAWLVAVLAGIPVSGVVRAVLVPDADPTRRFIGIAWPPGLPFWVDRQRTSHAAATDLFARGVLVSSPEFARILLMEWGPLFFGGLILGALDARRRIIVAFFLAGFLIACLLRVNVGSTVAFHHKASLDRFLFYGTCVGFMLSALWVERLEVALEQKSVPRAAIRGVTLALLVIPTILGPTGYIIEKYRAFMKQYYITHEYGQWTIEAGRLQVVLGAVGPRDLILTDECYAEKLVFSGFIVAPPLSGCDLEIRQKNHEPSKIIYFSRDSTILPARRQHRPRWLFLPEDNSRVDGQSVVARYGNYVLIRNPPS